MADLRTLLDYGKTLLQSTEQTCDNHNKISLELMTEIKSLHVQGRLLLRKMDRQTVEEYNSLFTEEAAPGADKYNQFVESRYWRSELGKCVGILRAIDQAGTTTALDKKHAKIFISHGTFSGAFDKTTNFVRALGMVPIYDIEVPTEGKTINKHVNKLIEDADFYIILAKYETTNKKGARLPNQNVVIEFDRLVESGASNLVVFLEQNCSMPSMLQDVIRVNFTEKAMDEAFTKLVAELKKQDLL